MATAEEDSFAVEGMALTQGILFPPEKICMEWQHSRSTGAGLYNLGNMCYLNAVLQCLTYTPPLANYLLSREHSSSCNQQGLCMMCIMEAHVCKVLLCSERAILPWSVCSILKSIGEHFQYGVQEDAHDFLRCAVEAMQTACLSGSSHLDITAQTTTIVQQIFGGSLRSRVTCLSCKADSDSYEPFLDLPLDIQKAPSINAALTDFTTPEQLDGQNCFTCSRCDRVAAASKKFTVHEAPRVLTLCLKRFDPFTGGKITKVVEYPEYLDLRPYMSWTSGEPLLYRLYAVLVHSGDSCERGHYYSYTKASDGLWHSLDDDSVHQCDVESALQQQAYLLFYGRCPDDGNDGESASSSAAPSAAPSTLSQRATGRKQAASSPCCQGNTARDRAQSRSTLGRNDLCSCVVDTTDYDSSAGRRGWAPAGHDPIPREDPAPGPFTASPRLAPAPRPAVEQTPPRQRKRKRSSQSNSDLPRGLAGNTDCKQSVRHRRRMSPECQERSPKSLCISRALQQQPQTSKFLTW